MGIIGTVVLPIIVFTSLVGISIFILWKLRQIEAWEYRKMRDEWNQKEAEKLNKEGELWTESELMEIRRLNVIRIQRRRV